MTRRSRHLFSGIRSFVSDFVKTAREARGRESEKRTGGGAPRQPRGQRQPDDAQRNNVPAGFDCRVCGAKAEIADLGGIDVVTTRCGHIYFATDDGGYSMTDPDDDAGDRQ
jgi:hypothetical protein